MMKRKNLIGKKPILRKLNVPARDIKVIKIKNTVGKIRNITK
jgi:hypothetical protein